jgi:hypothetical protein
MVDGDPGVSYINMKKKMVNVFVLMSGRTIMLENIVVKISCCQVA